MLIFETPAARRRRVWRHRMFVGTVLALLLFVSSAGALVVSDPDDLALLSLGASPGVIQLAGASRLVPTVPALANRNANEAATNVYAHTRKGMLTPVTRRAKYLVYVPDSQGNDVYVINPKTYKVIRKITAGAVVQHVVPAWDLHRLYATNDIGNSLTPINPDTGKRAGPNIPVADPYNMYFTPDGRSAIVVEEGRQVLAFRDPHTFALQKALHVHCDGVDHMDFSANGRFALASCEFSGQMVRIDLRTKKVAGYVHVGGSPQDVKLSPDGRLFYVANRYLPSRQRSGVQLINAHTMRLVGFIPTLLDAHGLYVSRNTKDLYVSNRAGGAVTVISFATRRIVHVWHVPGTPDMGGVSPNGRVLWLAGRYSSAVYAISTRTGKVIASIQAGISPHGLCVWPQPGRFSTGHTGVMR